MPRRPGEDLRKVTLNLYEADCAFLERYIGHGWTEQVRTLVHAHAEALQQPTYQKLHRDFGDLAE